MNIQDRDQPERDARFHNLLAAGVPEDPWNEVVFNLHVGSSEVQYPRKDFDAVVSVYDWHDDRLNWLPSEGTPHLVMPLYDANRIPDEKDLSLVVAFIDRYHSNGQSVLVRCQAGLNRSSLVTAIYLCENLGFTGQEAVDLIRSVRDGALFNTAFVRYLINKYKGES